MKKTGKKPVISVLFIDRFIDREGGGRGGEKNRCRTGGPFEKKWKKTGLKKKTEKTGIFGFSDTKYGASL
jgi:hypothetical protein